MNTPSSSSSGNNGAGNPAMTIPLSTNSPITPSSSNITTNHRSSSNIPSSKSNLIREIFEPNLQKELLLLEEQEGSINFKFGIVYAKCGQLIDDEMFSNGNEINRLYLSFKVNKNGFLSIIPKKKAVLNSRHF